VHTEGARRSLRGWLSFRRYLGNALRVRVSQSRVMQPIVATYHVTSYCNLNCTYCEDFGLRKNRAMRDAMLPLDGAQKVLEVLRTAVENVILTGGEPLVHPHIAEIAEHAARLRFHTVALITNGLLLPRRQTVLRHVTRLLVSLDSLDRQAWDQVLDLRAGTADRIIRNIEHYAERRAEFGYEMVLNCVVMPGTIDMARQVLDFCQKLGIGFSLSPQGINDQPHEALRDDPAYLQLIRDVIQLKDEGGSVVGSRVYLEHMLEFEDFQCYPTVNVRVLQNGDLVYPCRPIADQKDGRGGVAVNLLEVAEFSEAFERSVERFGEPPKGCKSCFQQCFAEPSLLIARPERAFGEFLRYLDQAQGKTT
jgi:MoaA/NifB/PqqE/SkfB family radical SAM enzyme